MVSLAKNEIRLQYSGFVLFASKVSSIVTGLAFQLMLIRSVTTTEYGIWGNINDLVLYFTLIAGILPFWTTRFVARNHENSAKTGLVTNVIISMVFTAVYILLAPFITSSLNIDEPYRVLYIVVSIQIIENYALAALQGIVLAKKPHMVGVGLLVHEFTKVFLGFMLVIVFNVGLFGILATLLIAYFIQLVFFSIIIKDYFKEKVEWKHFKEWLKASPINVYNIVGTQLASFGLIMLFAYGTEVARAYYGASLTVANVINYSAFLAFALYPRLLAEVKSEDITTSLRTVLMFIIPMTVGAIIMADSYLTILNVEYAEATLVLSLLALDLACLSLGQVLTNVVLGVEKLDEKARIPFRELLKSRIFQVFTLPYLRSLIVLPTAFYLLTESVAKNALEAAFYVAAVYFVADAVLLLCTYTIARRTTTLPFPWKNSAKYLAASAIMAGMLLLIPHPKRIVTTFAVTIAAGAFYLAVLFFIDAEAKSLIKSTLQEVKNKLI